MKKPIPDNPRYTATSSGIIIGSRGNPLKTRLNHRGYLRVNPGGQPTQVHRLILEAFVGPRPEGMQCRHLNGDKTDNRIANLCWGTAKENADDNRRNGIIGGLAQRRLPEEDVRAIRLVLQKPYTGVGKALAQQYGVSCDLISRIRTGRGYK